MLTCASTAWSPDSKRLASCSSDETVRVWLAPAVTPTLTTDDDSNNADTSLEAFVAQASAQARRWAESAAARSALALAAANARAEAADTRADAADTRARQGLPLVLFSAQPEPLLSLKSTDTTQRVPQKVLTTSRKLDEC
jgi:hypothetical protein